MENRAAQRTPQRNVERTPTCKWNTIRLVSVLTLPSLVGRIMFIVSRALSTSSSESLSLSLALKLSTRSLLRDSGGKLASSFELGGSSLSLETLSTPLQLHCCYFSHFPVAVEFAMK